MLRHRLHCKIERAETETYLTGQVLLVVFQVIFHAFQLTVSQECAMQVLVCVPMTDSIPELTLSIP